MQEDGARVGNVLWCFVWDGGTMEGRRLISPPGTLFLDANKWVKVEGIKLLWVSWSSDITEFVHICSSQQKKIRNWL